MPDQKRSHSKEAKEQPQRRRSSRQEGTEMMEAPGMELALPCATAGDLFAFLTDPRADHPANTPLKARIVSQLQQQYGNAYLQRAIAETRQDHRARNGVAAGRESSTEPEREATPSSAYDTTFRVMGLADGVRLSFTLGAHLDNGQARGATPSPEEEREKVEELEPIEVPSNILVGGEDAVTGRMRLQHTTHAGGANLGGAFGICQPIVRSILIGATPQPQLLGLLGTDYDVRVSADIEYHWDVQSLGRKHVSGPDDPDVTADTWSQVVYDLAPSSAAPGRSPRVEYWSRDLTSRHELYHRDDFVTAFTAFLPVSQLWLNMQSASSVDRAIRRGDQALQMLIANINSYMGSGDSAACEVRAYGDGRASYQARADGARAKAAREGWPEGIVILSS
jgi:hypothetical protein